MQNNTAQARPIRLGPEVAAGWVVQSGLQGGERVIVDGVIRVRPGATVSPVPVPSRPGRSRRIGPKPAARAGSSAPMISKFFIDRPIFASVLSIVIVLAGLLAMRVLPVAQYPEIVPPQVVVSATYPGASAQTIAETVAAPLEQQINGVEGMIYMQSTSTGSGTLNLSVYFQTGTDPDQATINVNNRVQRATRSPARGGAPSGRHRERSGRRSILQVLDHVVARPALRHRSTSRTTRW